MVVDQIRARTPTGLDEGGQSALEFLFVLPVLVGLTVIMIRVSAAIQTSIVEQKYARLAAHQFTFRSPKFPERNFRFSVQANQWVVGVQELPTLGNNVRPKASEIRILSRGPARDPQQFPSGAGAPEVLVRNTVTLCTQPIVLATGSAPSGLVENTQFPFCKGAFE